MKRITLFILMISLIFLLIACDTVDNTEPTKKPEVTATTTAEPTPTNTLKPTEDPTATSVPPEGFDANVEVPKADIFDALIKDGNVTDQSENALTVENVNEATVSMDDSIGKEVIALETADRAFFAVYGFGTQYEKLDDGFTFETYVKINNADQYTVVGGNQQAGGFSLEYDLTYADEEGALGLAVHNGTEYVKVQPDFRTEFERYYHIVCVYDGTKIKLYWNGRLLGEEEMGDDMKFPPDPVTQYLAIGADTGPDKLGEYYLDGSIAVFRLYNEPLNDSQIYKLYLEAIK